jgi:hypothetical protein
MSWFSRYIHLPICTHACLQPSNPLATRARLAAFFLAMIVIVFAAGNPATAQVGEWTWMGGIPTLTNTGVYGTLGKPDASNFPGGRENAVGWVDRHGDFWLFGGSGYDDSSYGNMLIDLWRYSPASSSASSELAGSDSTLTDDDATIPLNPNGELSHDRFGRDRDEATEHDFFNFGRKSTGCSSRFEPWN